MNEIYVCIQQDCADACQQVATTTTIADQLNCEKATDTIKINGVRYHSTQYYNCHENLSVGKDLWAYLILGVNVHFISTLNPLVR